MSNFDEFLNGTDPTSRVPASSVDYLQRRGRVGEGGANEASYNLGEAVTFTPTPFAPSAFIGWAKDLKTGTCSAPPSRSPCQWTEQDGRARFASAGRSRRD